MGSTVPDGADYRGGYLKLRSVSHDRATGLPVFPLLFDALRTALDTRRHVGVIQVEPGNLRLIESLYGWQVFDRIMGHAAAATRGAVGAQLPESTLLALDRVAGDRVLAFVIEPPGGGELDVACLRRLALSLEERVSEAFDRAEFRSLHPELIFRAGHAMLCQDPFYRFERQVYCALGQAAEVVKRREARRERSRGEELERIIRESAVHAVLQPVVALGSGRVHGYEAFARGPRGSVLASPRAMFAASGRLGVDAELDRLCLEAAVRASSASAHGRRVFVNVLTRTGSGVAAGDELLRLARDHALEPSRLVVELKERGAEEDPAAFFGSVDRFRDAGFGIAIDDVGTGFRTRRVISRVRPDFVKIDESLVRDVDDNLIKQEVLASLVDSASMAGSAVIAECVETESEADTLVRAGVGYAQGYWFAAPSPPSPGHPEGAAWGPTGNA